MIKQRAGDGDGLVVDLIAGDEKNGHDGEVSREV
jgi:hypothetical protein